MDQVKAGWSSLLSDPDWSAAYLLAPFRGISGFFASQRGSRVSRAYGTGWWNASSLVCLPPTIHETDLLEIYGVPRPDQGWVISGSRVVLIASRRLDQRHGYCCFGTSRFGKRPCQKVLLEADRERLPSCLVDADDPKVDVYSFGVVLWELWERRRPFEDVRSRFDIADIVAAGGRPAIGRGCPPPYADLMRRCWDQVCTACHGAPWGGASRRGSLVVLWSLQGIFGGLCPLDRAVRRLRECSFGRRRVFLAPSRDRVEPRATPF